MSLQAHKAFTPTGAPTNLNVGKLGYETAALDLGFKSRSNAPATIGPEQIREFMRQIWTPQILEHKFASNLLLWFFDAPVEDGWMNNLSVSHSARVTFKKWMNPLQRVRVNELEYKEGVTCPKQLKVDCVIPPAGPIDDYEQVDIDFKFEYSIRVDTCVKTRRLTLNETNEQWKENLEALSYRRAIDAWNALAEQIIASDTPILIPTFKTSLGATNYLQAGTADPYETLSKVFNYMGRAFGSRFNKEFVVTIHPDIALDIMVNHSDLLSYDKTGIRQDWLKMDQASLGGFGELGTLPRWYGRQVLVAPDDIAFHTGTPENANFSPWENADGTKVRAIIASRRSFFTKTVPFMDKTIFPATVEHPIETIAEIWIGGDKLLFPEETFLIEFNR